MHHRGDLWSLYIVVRHDVERSGKAIKPFVFNLLFDIQKNLAYSSNCRLKLLSKFDKHRCFERSSCFRYKSMFKIAQ